MIFAESLPLAKSFFAAAQVPLSTVGLLTRFVVACLNTLRCAAQVGDSIRSDPRHRAQIVRFLAREGWAKDWLTLERLAGVVLDSCRHEQGDWLFLLDQTLHTTCGLHAQNTVSCCNNKRNKKTKSNSKHTRKKSQANTAPPRRNHVFVFGLLISPQSGTRIPCFRPYYTEEYCQQRQARATPGKPAPLFATQADIAAQLIRSLPVPVGSRVLVLGDTAFEAKQIRAAGQQRGFDWITPANPERVLAGPKPRRRLADVSKDWTAETMTRIELCPGLSDWWRQHRGSKAKAWRGKYGRLYWAHSEILNVQNVGTVQVVFSTSKKPQTGQAVEVQKMLLTNLLHWDAKRVVAAYSTRWQIELFFKEMKSVLGMDNYRVRAFPEVEGWVRACCVAWCYYAGKEEKHVGRLSRAVRTGRETRPTS